MTRQFDSKVWATRSQQTVGNVTITFPAHNIQQSKPANRFAPVSVQRVKGDSKIQQRYYDEYTVADREKEATTGRWVLNVIAAHEAYQQALKNNKNSNQSNKKKHSFQPKKSTKVEPIETSSSQFINRQITNQNMDQFLHHTMFSPITIDDGQMTPMSNFSSAISVDHVRTPGRSSISSRTRSYIRSEDYSTDDFIDGEEQLCVSKRIMIICTILSVILIIGIIVAVLITIFVGRNESTTANAKSLDPKSLLVPLSSISDLMYPTEMFNITDPSCQGQVPYNYYSCYQMATSTSFTIRFALQHDTMSGHWYFDDISAVQNDNIQLIMNGGFESNLTGWILNISSNSTPETYVDTTTDLAHTGLAYLYGGSKNDPAYIEQTFNVTQGEYINVSFWWGYDGGLKLGSTCQAIGKLF